MHEVVAGQFGQDRTCRIVKVEGVISSRQRRLIGAIAHNALNQLAVTGQGLYVRLPGKRRWHHAVPFRAIPPHRSPEPSSSSHRDFRSSLELMDSRLKLLHQIAHNGARHTDSSLELEYFNSI
jgi:hypothetical protein